MAKAGLRGAETPVRIRLQGPTLISATCGDSLVITRARLATFHGTDKWVNQRVSGASSNRVNFMANHRVLHFVLLASGALLMAACASQPTSSLDEKYFQKEASNYLKFQHEGQTVYCQTEASGATLIPFDPNRRCISEAALRQAVQNYRVSRNAPSRGGPQYVATVPGGSGT